MYRVLDKRIAENVMKLLDADLEKIKHIPFQTERNECLALLKLLKGSLYRIGNKFALSRQALELENEIIVDTYIPPFINFELGLLLFEEGEIEKGIETLLNIRKRYNKYLFESKLNFRISSAIRAWRNK